MDSLGNILGNFAIKNDNDINLFKVYFHENGITFNKKFHKGVLDNFDTALQFENINKIWNSETRDKKEVIEAVMFMLEHFQVYLSTFFYNEDEIREMSEEFKSNNLDIKKNEFDIYFDKIKKTRDLKPITRKDFESKIIDEKIGEYYVENFELAKEASFFTYKSDNDKDCFIMVKNDRIKIGFAEK